MRVTEPIIDAPLVTDHPLLIKKQRLRGARHAEQFGHALIGVMEHRKGHLEIPGLLDQLFARHAGVRVDADDLQALLLIGVLELLELRQVQVCHRTTLAHDKQDNDVLVLEVR